MLRRIQVGYSARGQTRLCGSDGRVDSIPGETSGRNELHAGSGEPRRTCGDESVLGPSDNRTDPPPPAAAPRWCALSLAGKGAPSNVQNELPPCGCWSQDGNEGGGRAEAQGVAVGLFCCGLSGRAAQNSTRPCCDAGRVTRPTNAARVSGSFALPGSRPLRN
jgi:hypothetical protein